MHRQKSLVESTSAESFIRDLEIKISTNGLGGEKYTRDLKAPPGLTTVSKGAHDVALKQYKSVIISEVKSRETKDDVSKNLS